MESNNEREPLKKRRGAATLERKLRRLTVSALNALGEILADTSAKPADRISAAKLAFDTAARFDGRPDTESGGIIRVVFDGAPEEWAE